MSETDVAAPEGGPDEIDDAAQIAAEAQEEASPEVVEATPEPVPEPVLSDEAQQRIKDAKGMAHQERAKRQESDRRAAELEARLAAIEAKTATPARERPDPNVDPIAYVEWLGEKYDAIEAAKAEATEQTAAQQEHAAYVAEIQSDETAFAADTPDYYDALTFLRDARVKELTDLGASPERAAQKYAQEVAEALQQAKADGISPSRLAYKYAKDRGFTGKVSPQEQAQEKLNKVAAGQKAQNPLANAGGRGGDDLTMETINGLKGQAFLDAAAKLEKRMLAQERGF